MIYRTACEACVGPASSPFQPTSMGFLMSDSGITPKMSSIFHSWDTIQNADRLCNSSLAGTLCGITFPQYFNRRPDPASKCLYICVPVWRMCVDVLSINQNSIMIQKSKSKTRQIRSTALLSWITFLCLLISISLNVEHAIHHPKSLDSLLQTLISLHFLERNATLCGHAAEKTKRRMAAVEIKRPALHSRALWLYLKVHFHTHEVVKYFLSHRTVKLLLASFILFSWEMEQIEAPGH